MDDIIRLSQQLRNITPIDAQALLSWVNGDGLEQLHTQLETELYPFIMSLPVEPIALKLIQLEATINVIFDISQSVVVGEERSPAVLAVGAPLRDVLSVVKPLAVPGGWTQSSQRIVDELTRGEVLPLARNISLTAERPAMTGRHITEAVVKGILERDAKITEAIGNYERRRGTYEPYRTLNHLITFTEGDIHGLAQALPKVLNFYFYSILDMILILPNTYRRDALLTKLWDTVDKLGLKSLRNELQDVTNSYYLPSREALIRWILAH